LADLVIDRRIGPVVLAEHFEVDAKGRPAHAEVRLPLQLHVAAGDRQRHVLAVLVLKGDRAVLAVDGFHRHVEHAAGSARSAGTGE
jgi:hypothetical protein